VSTVEIVRVGTERPRLVLDQLGDDTIQGGHGGWSTQARPGRPDMTAWDGTPAVQWTIPMSFDGFDAGRSVERNIATLESWGLPDTDAGDEPPRLTITALAGRGRATAKWVIQSIEYGEQIRNDSGQRIRQDVTVTFLEYVPGQVLKGPAAKSRGKSDKKHKWVPRSAKDRRCKVCGRPRDHKIHTNRG
jgi:hypothetical protein